MQNPERSLANSCPIFIFKHLTSPVFKTQQETQQDSTQVEAKISVNPPPFQALEAAVQKALVVSPIFSSNSHLLTSKFLHKIPFDVN